ncbi:hypothetical protein TWF106_002737 [Orbilia oligospora]|uniref:Secreted protein n=1 Tax=Orbilia oligospora TaxID=2813651 RepID=A0A6G1LSC6_ORBOL|nr:hypothetical protein TWF788_003750 [Orbilia oligospora]KAF3197904.1 hypothetical protein TWF679_002531 [Orbilia oligospora]KAF3201688.1 hypothetical protein TWF106_002737 [Orbilia oligospora]KAF3230514.1 hypothetical protein TWF191_009434 [Orbilia oligospora]KAF3233009.1 hypothetical protein TWF192_002561 [Orbilia oligospora]
MPSNRPFLASLFVAFRAHSALQKPSAPVSTASASAATSNSTIVTPTRSALPCSTAAQHGATATPQQSPPQSISNTRQHSPTRRRRSSSSSTDGAMNGGTGEKWWIGGRAGDGQARFYQLQPVRHRSLDRLSLDRMSL